MTQIQQAPTALRETTGASITVQYKGSVISLSKLQCSLFILLSDGKRYTSHQIMKLIHTSDPRKEVQYLRRKGINIQDEWIAATDNTPRHKRYWIDPVECTTNWEGCNEQ